MIDLEELEHNLRTMKPRQHFYETVKRVLTEQGRWKNKPRGFAANLEKWRELEEQVDERVEDYDPFAPLDR